MRRLTTPEHRFVLQVEPSLINKIRITYSQENQIVLTKENEDIILENNVATTRLTQEETKKFKEGKEVEIQVRILTLGNNALASEIIKIEVKKVLDEEVMV